MAGYIANNATRDTVNIIMTKAEAAALSDLAIYADVAFDEFGDTRNAMTKQACARALRAIEASINTSARRAGFFDT